ncbi:MAG: ankyrin repeat domain-containing protein, partial [Rhodoferax sp.]
MKYYIRYAIYAYVLIGFSFVYGGSYEDFFRAVKFDDSAAVATLLQRGFDPNTHNPQHETGLLLALREPSPKVAEVLIAWPSTQVEVRSAQDESPLMLAALKGYTALCQQLIVRDADVNKPGWTPLH